MSFADFELDQKIGANDNVLDSVKSLMDDLSHKNSQVLSRLTAIKSQSSGYTMNRGLANTLNHIYYNAVLFHKTSNNKYKKLLVQKDSHMLKDAYKCCCGLAID